MEIKKQRHPSYGLLAFSRCHGGQTSLFGSSIKHTETIRMRLQAGAVERHLNTDFYYTDGLIAEIEMSQAQFAEAITSMNSGTGVPVTIRYLRGTEKIPECPFTDKKDQYEDEFKQNVESSNTDINKIINEVQAMFDTKKALTQKEKQHIMSLLQSLQNKIGANRTFIYNCFNEQVDKTITDAKCEIEAFTLNKMLAVANNTLIENNENNTNTTPDINDYYPNTLITNKNIDLNDPNALYVEYYNRYKNMIIKTTLPPGLYETTYKKFTLQDTLPEDMTFDEYVAIHGFDDEHPGYMSFEDFKKMYLIRISDPSIIDAKDIISYLKAHKFIINTFVKLSDTEYICDDIGEDPDNITYVVF